MDSLNFKVDFLDGNRDSNSKSADDQPRLNCQGSKDCISKAGEIFWDCALLYF